MATTADLAAHSYHRSLSLSPGRSPDQASTVYPDRAIRPLPRSRLRSKLSPEQVSSLVFPPSPPPISPTLSFSVQETGTPAQQPRLTNGDVHHHHHHHHDHDHDHDDHDHHHHHHHHHTAHHDHCTCDHEGDSGDDEVEFDHPDYRYATAPMPNGEGLKPESLQRRLVEASRASHKPPPPGSTGSSGDGYESFENTSNKKKRKIPLSSASSMHQSQLSAELANMGISNSHPEVDDDALNAAHQQHYDAHAAPTAGSGTGISGAGRGRYGRQDGRIRRPLGSSTMNTINGYHSRSSPRGGDARNEEDPGIENTGGIISQAIKTAAEQGPLTPAAKGRENFTFTCESDSATKMLDQQGQYLAGTPTPARSMPQNTHGTQTSPPLCGQQPPVIAQRPPPPPTNSVPTAAHPPQQQAPPPKPRPRRNPAKEYAMQAAQRKKNQQYQNYHHRPKPDDMWICEFCEYEDIYGAPPYALIRAYEIKDRKERKKAEEKRRLLEKAKMKGRKNKKGAGKGNKNNVNNATAPAPPSHSQNYDPNLPPPDDEEYYDDEDYAEDDYEPIGPDDQYQQEYAPPAPTSTPVAASGGARPQHI